MGKLTVATPGTPVRLTVNQPDPTAVLGINSFVVQALPANTGSIYLGLIGMSRATLANVVGIITAPTGGGLPQYGAVLTYSPGGIDLRTLYIDADVAGEGVLCSAVVG